MERTLDVTVLGTATLLYADWIPQWNGSPGALPSNVVNHIVVSQGVSVDS